MEKEKKVRQKINWKKEMKLAPGYKSCPGIIGTDCNGSFVDIKKFPEIMRLAFEFEIFIYSK